MLSNSMNVTQFLRALVLPFAIILTLHASAVGAVFEGCDHTYKIYTGYTYNLASPNYPGSYNPGSSCRYRYTAPKNHHIVVTCSINLNKVGSDCTSESFYIAVNGDLNLQGSERLCGLGTVTRHSLFETLVLAYVSQGSVGNFACTLQAIKSKCQCGWSANAHIANGNEAAINEYPSMVALTTIRPIKKLFCSAIIISSRYLLTAAHCALFYELDNIEAWVGRHNIESTVDTDFASAYYISKVIVHEHYVREPLNHDIALLQTSSDILFSRGVGPICLPPHTNINNQFDWQEVDVIGWGAIKFSIPTSPTLQKITVMTTDHATCQHLYRGIDTIFPTQICTRDPMRTSKDSCQNDSGGPVIFRQKNIQYLVGIISFGRGCASKDDPIGVNTRVTSYVAWIHRKTGNSICTIPL